MRNKSKVEIEFDRNDTKIFKIRDVKTKINTVQNYFFPRLELLTMRSIELIRNVYGIDAFERYSLVYYPSNRKNAKENSDFSGAYVGISGKRDINRKLNIFKKGGEQFSYYPTYLMYEVNEFGTLRVRLQPYRYLVDLGFKHTVNTLLVEYGEVIQQLISIGYLSYDYSEQFQALSQSIMMGGDILSQELYFPIDNDHGIFDLMKSFCIMFPIFELLIDMADGVSNSLTLRVDSIKKWLEGDSEYFGNSQNDCDEEIDGLDDVDLPELDSYTYIRAGIWWDVLSRDQWKCCACGRTAHEGYTLEVDHILPRSKGGTNDKSNLQTLCKKCNIGKSNKDTTDLRFIN